MCYSWFTAYLLLYGDIMENTLNENKVTQQNMYDICWNLYKDIVRSENIFVEKGSFDDLKDIINFDRNNAFKISDKPIRVKDLVSYNLRF